LDIAQSFVKD